MDTLFFFIFFFPPFGQSGVKNTCQFYRGRLLSSPVFYEFQLPFCVQKTISAVISSAVFLYFTIVLCVFTVVTPYHFLFGT